MTEPRITHKPGKFSIAEMGRSGPRVPRIDDAFVGTKVPSEHFTEAGLSGFGSKDRPLFPSGNIRIVRP